MLLIWGLQGGCFLERYACQLQATRSIQIEEEPGRRLSIVEASGADVGDAVAFGVGAAGAGSPSDVGSQGVGGAEAGALAYEHDDE